MKFLTKLFVILGLLSLLIGVAVWKVPAGWILGNYDWSGKSISYARIKGTLWQGSMEQVQHGDVLLGDVSWDFQTINRLFPTITTWKVAGKGLDFNLEFFADIEGLRPENLRMIQGQLPAGWVDLSKAAPLLFLSGRFNIDLDHLSPSQNPASLATGIIRWVDAGLTGLVEEPLGNILIELRREDGFTIADIQTEEPGDTMISGEVKLNGAQYRTSLTLITTEEKQYLVEQLAHLGSVTPDGALELNLSGRLPR